MPVRAVDEEVLLTEGSHSLLLAEILITTPVGAAGGRVVDTQLCIGGPVRDMLMSCGVFSAIVERRDASAAAAA